jgi:hypothetical protein
MDYLHSELWYDYFLALATSAAALVGLLFVVNSLNVRELTRDMLFRRRARNILLVMTLLFGEGLAGVVPQGPITLGAEISAFHLVMLYFPISAIWHLHQQKVPIPIIPIGAGIVFMTAGAAGGGLLMVRWPWSLHLIAAANVGLIFVLIANAWSLLLGFWRTAPQHSPNDHA